MSFEIQFTITPVSGNCRYTTLDELTGIYNATDNPGGWDIGTHTSPNPAVSDILTAVLAITDKTSGETWATDLDPLGTTPILYDVAQNAINTPLLLDGTYYGLTAADNIPYGNYEYTLHVTGLYGLTLPQESFDQEPSVQKYQYCTLQCCVDQMFTEATASSVADPCDNKKLQAAQTADGWLTALEYAADDSDFDSAQGFADLISEMCNGKCGCGCS